MAGEVWDKTLYEFKEGIEEMVETVMYQLTTQNAEILEDLYKGIDEADSDDPFYLLQVGYRCALVDVAQSMDFDELEAVFYDRFVSNYKSLEFFRGDANLFHYSPPPDPEE